MPGNPRGGDPKPPPPDPGVAAGSPPLPGGGAGGRLEGGEASAVVVSDRLARSPKLGPLLLALAELVVAARSSAVARGRLDRLLEGDARSDADGTTRASKSPETPAALLALVLAELTELGGGAGALDLAADPLRLGGPLYWSLP